MDESFKRLVDALTYKGILNNTIIVFFGDNGAPLPQLGALTHGSNYGSNWPLRHGKGSHFDGGVRTDSFIWSPLLPKRGRITDQLFHATDWLPTMYEAAGGDVNQLGDRPGDLSGVSQWKSLYSKYKVISICLVVWKRENELLIFAFHRIFVNLSLSELENLYFMKKLHSWRLIVYVLFRWPQLWAPDRAGFKHWYNVQSIRDGVPRLIWWTLQADQGECPQQCFLWLVSTR